MLPAVTVGFAARKKTRERPKEERRLQIPPAVSTQDDRRTDHDSSECRRGGSAAKVTGERYGHLRALGLRH